MTKIRQLLTALLCAVTCMAATPSLADVRPGPIVRPHPGPPLWLCPLLGSPLMTLNGACVAAPVSIAVAKDPQHGGGSSGAGAAPHQGANPNIMVISLGPGFSSTLANWAHAGGPPATVVINTYDGHHNLQRSVTLHGATPTSLTSANVLTLHYDN